MQFISVYSRRVCTDYNFISDNEKRRIENWEENKKKSGIESELVVIYMCFIKRNFCVKVKKVKQQQKLL